MSPLRIQNVFHFLQQADEEAPQMILG